MCVLCRHFCGVCVVCNPEHVDVCSKMKLAEVIGSHGGSYSCLQRCFIPEALIHGKYGNSTIQHYVIHYNIVYSTIP